MPNYLLRQKAKQEKIIEKLKILLSIIAVIIIDKNSILLALNSDFEDFEDALQNYAAEQNGEINLIVTRNTKDYKKSELGIMDPEDLLKYINANNKSKDFYLVELPESLPTYFSPSHSA